MKILFLSSWFPHPPDNGSKIRVFNLLKGLALENEVTLISFFEPSTQTQDLSELDALCQKIIRVPSKSFDPKSFRSKVGFITPNPRSLMDTFSTDAAHCIQNIVQDEQFDLVIVSQIGMARYRRFFRHLPAIFEEVELGVPYQRAVADGSVRSRVRANLTWLKHRRYITKLLKEFQACTVVSLQEKQLVKTIVPDMENITIIPNCIDLREYSGFERTPSKNTLIFTGSFRYQANYEAMEWFLGEVFPLIRSQVPDSVVTITGDHCDLPLPVRDNVRLTGYVDDVRPLIASSWISLAPLLTGGGTRLKILEAMALGTPVLATSKGAEGLDAQAGRDLLIADSPEDFAQSVIQLFREEELRKNISVNGYRLVSEKYDWVRVMPKFLELASKVGVR